MNRLSGYLLGTAAMFAALAGMDALAAAAPAANAQVQVDGGSVRGVAQDGVLAFKGIPYAAPPVAALRWRPPQPVPAWQGVLDASHFKPDCAQEPFPGDAAPLGVAPAEDCLGLNVWAPATASAKPRPVLVWIYGGGFVNGGSSPAVYDGSAFARRGVILVSFNYRVGRFGFFAHPALSAEARALGEPTANYGYLDQLAALKWVKANIAAFGGDPGNVTVFGESAGGKSVLQWLGSPAASGLFRRAAVLSGGGRGPLLPMRELTRANAAGQDSAESVGVAFAHRNGIEGDGAAALAALRALPADTVVDGLNLATMGAAMATYVGGPVRDGTIVTGTADQALRAGTWAKVPVLIGSTSDDLGLSGAKTREELFAPFGADAAKARALYDPDGRADFARLSWQVAMDRVMAEPARFVAREVVRQGQPAHLYRFSYVAQAQRGQWQGAPHASELPYVFDTLPARYGAQVSAADRRTAALANAYWAHFAVNGDPNGAGLPRWPAYDPGADGLMDFSPQGPKYGADPRRPRLDLVERSQAAD